MSKSTLFALACFLLVSVTVGDYHARGYRSRRRLLPLTSVTPTEVCMSRGYDAACMGVSCTGFKCYGFEGVTAYYTKAPNGMWCADGGIRRSGVCVKAVNVATNTRDLQYIDCI